MLKKVIAWGKINGARAISLVTGRVPDAGSWPMVWAGTRRFSPRRSVERDRGFERRPFAYRDAVDFLCSQRRGSARDIREGSIPEDSLAFIAGFLPELGAGAPLRGLHIGNFVGLSLAYLTDAVQKAHPRSIVLSVDPNIPHRGFDVPGDLVTGLMARYGLTGNWLPVCGYSFERGIVADLLNRRHATTAFSSYYGYSAERVLQNLRDLGLRFDFVLIDGNHGADHLRREIGQLAHLVRPGGLLFLDDVDENWDGVTQVFEELDSRRFRRRGLTGRIGVVERLAEAERPGQGGGPGKPGRRRKPGPGGRRGTGARLS